jgi:UDP-2-acetamido-2,6-beta-L-arabino-hexul-4-ose reductase
MRILVTGANGFIGSNLIQRLKEMGEHEILPTTNETSPSLTAAKCREADFVFHLAGVNRPRESREFQEGNVDFTSFLCQELAKEGRSIPVVFSSSTQATLDNPYGVSKREAEEVLAHYGDTTGSPVRIFRLTNVFGKWSRPDYNSAVATFSHNIARGLPITVNDPRAPLRLVYIDHVVDAFLAQLGSEEPGLARPEVSPVFETTVGEVARILEGFRESRSRLVTAPVGTGLVRALWATYVSFLPPSDFAYTVPIHRDPRGEFAEMLRTADSGQFSYFTAGPGVTRGEHYHHSKTEKFLVIRGTARFQFRNVLTLEACEFTVQGGSGAIVETVPGWTHNVTNIGTDELIIMLWANECFDPTRPDTMPMKVSL